MLFVDNSTFKILGILQVESTIQKKFLILSKIILVSGLTNSILTILLIPYIGIYAVFIIPTVSLILSIAYALYRLRIVFKFQIILNEIIRIVMIGLPLSLGALWVGGYRYTERVAVIYFFDVVYMDY